MGSETSLEPLVSVIIPVYRQAHLVGEAIDSVIAQTLKPVEIVVVNDGSPDNCFGAVAKYGPSVKYLAQDNQGLSAARNSGIMAATGRYLLFLDADDLLLPACLEQLCSAIRDTKNCLARIGYKIVSYRNASTPESYGIPDQPTNFLAELVQRNLPVHSYLIERSLAVEIGGFDRSLKSCEDWDFWFRAAFSGASVVSVQSIGIIYRLFPNSMSSQKMVFFSARCELLLKINSTVHTRSLKDTEVMLAIGRVAYGLLKEGNKLYMFSYSTPLRQLIDLLVRDGFYPWRRHKYFPRTTKFLDFLEKIWSMLRMCFSRLLRTEKD